MSDIQEQIKLAHKRAEENDIKLLQEENKKLKELCNKYEEEHKTTFEEWKKDTRILTEIEQWLEVNDKYSQGYFKQVLNYINILKGDNK